MTQHYDQLTVSRKRREGKKRWGRGGGERDRKRRGERSESMRVGGYDHLAYGRQCMTQPAVGERGKERERERGGGGEMRKTLRGGVWGEK